MNYEKKYIAIVIGVSSGGLSVLSSIFEILPADYKIPIIAVQHRTKDQNELLEELLQHKCAIKVKQADEKEKIKNGFVYLAPPDYHLLIENNFTFSLSIDVKIKFSRPSIDVLFESASLAYREKLVGIILTGANNDGSDGIKMIRKNGGETIAQDPLDAEFPFMPQAAIKTGCVKQILSLAEIQKFLLQINP